MRSRLYATCVVLAVTLFAGPGAVAQPGAAPNVLILQSLDSQTDPYLTVTQTFRARFQSYYDNPVSFAEISLDARWGGRKDREPFQVQLIRNRIDVQRPDIVVCIGPSAIDFWQRYRDRIADSIPTVMAARESFIEASRIEPGDAGVFSEWSIPSAVDHILTLLPETREVVIVFGGSELERAQTDEAQRLLADYPADVSFTYTSDLAMDDIERLLSEPPEHTAVLLGIFSVDARGLIFPLNTGVEKLVAASNVPVFSAFDTAMGSGVVGGRLIPLVQQALDMADQAVLLLDSPGAEPVVRIVPQSAPTYDWRALRRWGIDAERLPPGSTVLFREPTLWAKYGHWVVLAVAIVVVQMLMIAALLIQRRRLRRAERAASRLSSRLITAHEEERRRVARELHDDLSQRLAGLAIDASFLSSTPDEARRAQLLHQMQPELVRISKDVHDLSYRLHPSIVEEIGLIPAMRAEMDRIGRVTSLAIVDKIRPLRDRPDRDVALCLYRITQESLQNAARHAQATTVTVRLRQGRRFYVLEITDDGQGFAVTDPDTEHGIGISGMRERARGVRGALRVSSAVGKGTRIKAKLPVRETIDETNQRAAGG